MLEIKHTLVLIEVNKIVSYNFHVNLKIKEQVFFVLLKPKQTTLSQYTLTEQSKESILLKCYYFRVLIGHRFKKIVLSLWSK